ncbi:sigma-54 dependent transcriptional regulator [Desulfobacula sp.]|uniref:sigma-54-dependent transcriptional regulator n=1 Tax=Desulfobacula sp. TaxID=2593537 RepID=UPI00262A28C6|nr:sigma-54 dependent transcriptional regulator [Desulfobacula sp.]
MTENFKILVVDDEDSVRKRCIRLLSRQGYNVIGASDSSSALSLLQNQRTGFDLLLVDIRMPGMDGIQLLKKIKTQRQSIEVIIMTGYATVETAIKSMKYGAFDYLTKPFDKDELLHAIDKIVKIKSLQQEIKELKSQLTKTNEKPIVIGNSSAMNKVMRVIEKVSPVDSNILIQGESGTGKGFVAKAIHARSKRKKHPFVVADCAALSGNILESELFGHVKGAYTGAHADREGYFKRADKGTLFLDEIGEVPLDLQGKLLRVVQDKAFVKLGSTEMIKVDTRIIAATNRNLEDMVSKGEFREDLFYRLNIITLSLPALRERREDIPLLARHFLKWYTAKLNFDTLFLPDEVLETIVAYDWPGNIRELENAMQRAIVLAENNTLSIDGLFPARVEKDQVCFNYSDLLKKKISYQEMKQDVLQNFTKEYLTQCLIFHKGNITNAAKTMGMRRTSLQRLVNQTGLDSQLFKNQ